MEEIQIKFSKKKKASVLVVIDQELHQGTLLYRLTLSAASRVEGDSNPST
jgi:hypothetical protein